MSTNDRKSWFSLERLANAFRLKEPDALHGPSLIRTSGTSPGKPPKRINIHRDRRHAGLR